MWILPTLTQSVPCKRLKRCATESGSSVSGNHSVWKRDGNVTNISGHRRVLHARENIEKCLPLPSRLSESILRSMSKSDQLITEIYNDTDSEHMKKDAVCNVTTDSNTKPLSDANSVDSHVLSPSQSPAVPSQLSIVTMKKDTDVRVIHGWQFREENCVLGEGTYGRVYHMYHFQTKKERAVKRTFLRYDGFPSWLLREISLLHSLKHPNIVPLEEVFIGPERVYLSFPFIKGGNLMKFLTQHYAFGMPSKLIKQAMQQLLSAVHYCHKNRVIHRDLKPENILCQTNGDQLETILLADFGLARSTQWPNQAFSPEIITLSHRPLEILLGMPNYTSAVDMWSVGCILLEMLIGPDQFADLFFGDDVVNEFSVIMQLFNRFGKPTELEWPSLYSLPYASHVLPNINVPHDPLGDVRQLCEEIEEPCLDLLRQLLVLNPDHRITSSEALQHAWFTT